MSTLREHDEETAKKKGLMAGAALAATGVAAVVAGPVLGLFGLVPTAYLAYDASNLYVAFVCKAADPSSIRARMAKRDRRAATGC